MNFIKVKLTNINIGEYGVGSVVDMEEQTAKQLEQSKQVEFVPIDTPYSIKAPLSSNELLTKVRVPKQPVTYAVSRGANTVWTTTTKNNY